MSVYWKNMLTSQTGGEWENQKLFGWLDATRGFCKFGDPTNDPTQEKGSIFEWMNPTGNKQIESHFRRDNRNCSARLTAEIGKKPVHRYIQCIPLFVSFIHPSLCNFFSTVCVTTNHKVKNELILQMKLVLGASRRVRHCLGGGFKDFQMYPEP